MKDALERLAHRAREVADKAEAARGNPGAMNPLFGAMMEYREAALAYFAHPTMGDLIKAQALKYDGPAREAVERIAELIDSLNKR